MTQEQNIEERFRELKESEEVFRTIAEKSSMGILIIQDNLIKYVNQLASNICGYSIEEIKSWQPREFLKILHPDDRELVMEQALKKQSGAKDFIPSYNTRVIKKTGEIIWVDNYTNTIIYKGKPADLVLLTDITEKKEVEKKLKESEERHRLFLQNFQGIAYQVEYESFQPNFFHGMVEQITGYTSDEFMQGNNLWQKIIHPDDLNNLIQKGRELSSNVEQAISVEYRIIHKNGDIKWVNDTGRFVYDDSSNLLIQGAVYDITERKRAEQIIKESEGKYRTLFESSIDGIVMTDLEGKILECNQAYSDILGYTKEEVKKLTYQEVTPQKWHKIEENIVKNQIFLLGYSDEYEKEYIKKDGTIITINIRIWLVKDNNGEPIGMWGIIRDITDRKKAELKIRESEARSREAYNRANFYKDLFAHDINNILQNILSASELSSLYLTKNEQKEKLSKTLDIIKEQTQKGAALISKVRRLSELEESQMSLESTEIYNILKNSIEFSKNSFPNRIINIKVESSNESIFVKANKLISEVFENVLLNGITHNRSPKVEINIKISETQRDENNYVKLEFQDNGVGISDDQKKFIFEKKTDGYESGRGMGIGLSLVKTIIDSFNGQICVEDRVEEDYSKGCNFILLIPKAE